jgi:hypothetical protein
MCDFADNPAQRSTEKLRATRVGTIPPPIEFYFGNSIETVLFWESGSQNSRRRAPGGQPLSAN